MDVGLEINNSPSPAARFLNWAPSPCRARVTNPAGAAGAVAAVELSAAGTAGGGAVVFAAAAGGPFAPTLTLTLPTGGASVSFFAAGQFGSPSTAPDDVTLEARVGGTLVGSAVTMVRVRQDANTLSTALREAFLAAFATLNNQGLGRFADFRAMHTGSSDRRIHRGSGFLPWHRAYLLDLERELQAIDPVVSLPYWRFDAAADNVFRPDFMGSTDPADPVGAVDFAAANPLRFWRTDNTSGVFRQPNFVPATDAAAGGFAPVLSEADTLGLGNSYRLFSGMETNPHGAAHTCFSEDVSDIAIIPTAAKDPLFFLLHCNVDRLWAKWQRASLARMNPASASAFFTDPDAGVNPTGHNLTDLMWPWSGTTIPALGALPAAPAVGGGFAVDPVLNAPGLTPLVSDLLDYQGKVAATARLGFDYDDVSFF